MSQMDKQVNFVRTNGQLKLIPSTLPVLPLREKVAFPNTMETLILDHPKSQLALEAAMNAEKYLLLLTQHDAAMHNPTPADLYKVGSVAECVKMYRMPDDTYRVTFDVIARVKILHFTREQPFFEIIGDIITDTNPPNTQASAMMRSLTSQYEKLLTFDNDYAESTLSLLREQKDYGKFADILASTLNLTLAEKQEILTCSQPMSRLELVALKLAMELEVQEIEQRINTKMKDEMDAGHRNHYLRGRMKAIQDELGDNVDREAEFAELRQKTKDSGMPENIGEKILKEINRLENIPIASPEITVTRTYIDWILSMPWNKRSEECINLKAAEDILNNDHWGLAKTKERILEYLAVRKLNPTMNSPILCFVGPPGVGKTSIGKSIADALGRKFLRISLGGMHDESEIRGHRRTYVAALPGRIIQGMKSVGMKNPVFMMDEIDKIGQDFRGNPSSALLEVLDPEQNNTFSDHYLEVPFDLSEVMFITTANLLDPIPPALRDRMEVIEFPGYTEDEKLHIARHFLLPKQLKQHGLSETNLQVNDTALSYIIRHYTREAGVRNLEREIGTVCRKIARQVVDDNKKKRVTVKTTTIPDYLGGIRYRFGMAGQADEIGVATGLAYTATGGDVLAVEVGLMSGKGLLQLTGHLGEVMQESARTAVSYARSHAAELGIKADFATTDIHIHVPEGQTPKDGPSAGITIACALISALSELKLHRHVAMTGEITLRGRVLPVGGIKEKMLGAHRAGITDVILPAGNQKDLEELPENVVKALRFHYVEHMPEVLEIALCKG